MTHARNQKAQQLFVQSLMARGILSANEVVETYKFAHNIDDAAEVNVDHMRSFVKSVNDRIKPFHLEIKKATDYERTGSQSYVLVNRMRNDATVASSVYSILQYEYFKKIVAAIMGADGGCIGSIEALNLCDQLEKKLNKKDAEDFLDKLKRDKWLSEDRNGTLYLHTRAIYELEPYLREVFNTPTCSLCHMVVIRAQNQTCPSCGYRAHSICINKVYKNKEKLCLNDQCRVPWAKTENTQGSQTPSQNIRSSQAGSSRSMPSAKRRNKIASDKEES